MKNRLIPALSIVILLATGLVFLTVNRSMQSRLAMPSALDMLVSDTQLSVTEAEWIVLQPAGGDPETGLILFPGGYVDVRAYAPIARLVAVEGFMVVLVEPPLATALLAIDEVGRIAAAYPQIEHWAVGGHSLGGVAAAQAADKYPGLVDGVVLMASAPASGNDLSDGDAAVLAIFGSADAIFPASRLDRNLVPDGTTYLEIEGGNHAQFGRYGDGTQSGDGTATITREQQEQEVAEHTVLFLHFLGD